MLCIALFLAWGLEVCGWGLASHHHRTAASCASIQGHLLRALGCVLSSPLRVDDWEGSAQRLDGLAAAVDMVVVWGVDFLKWTDGAHFRLESLQVIFVRHAVSFLCSFFQSFASLPHHMLGNW